MPPLLPVLHEAIMPTLLSLLAAYVDEAMAYVGLSLGTSKGEPGEPSEGVAQYSGVSAPFMPEEQHLRCRTHRCGG